MQFLFLLAVDCHVVSLFPPAMYPKSAGAKAATGNEVFYLNKPSIFLGSRQRCITESQCSNVEERMQDINDDYEAFMQGMDVCTNPHLGEDDIDILNDDFAIFKQAGTKFAQLPQKLAPSGKPWLENSVSVASYCPGETITGRTYLAIDHNGVFAWSRRDASGNWVPFTEWRSVNMDPDAKYFDVHNKPWKGKECSSEVENTKDGQWSPQAEHCRMWTTFEYDFHIPLDAAAGKFVMQYTYMGGVDKDSLQDIGVQYTNPEKALFLSCTYVNIKNPEDCSTSASTASTKDALTGAASVIV